MIQRYQVYKHYAFNGPLSLGYYYGENDTEVIQKAAEHRCVCVDGLWTEIDPLPQYQNLINAGYELYKSYDAEHDGECWIVMKDGAVIHDHYSRLDIDILNETFSSSQSLA